MPTTEFAEEVQQRTQILIDQTKKNIMQSYLKYKDYYDRKAKVAPLKEKDYCFVLQPKADSQASKIPFKEYRWIGPFVIQKVLSNDNYIVRRLNTNKTQILHRIREKKFVPNAPLEDKYDGEKLQPDNEIVIPQDDLYTISWEVDFEYDLFEPRKENWTDVATRRPTDAESTNTDNDVTDEESASNESCSERTTRNYVTENERASNESYNERTTEYDVTEDEISPRENNSSDEPSPPRLKRHSALRMKMTSLMIYKIRKTFQTQAQILPCPEYQKMEIQMKIRALEEGNTIFDLTLPPTLLMNTDTSQKI